MDQILQSCIRGYMEGVDRTNRKYKTQEVFTPDWMVKFCLNEIAEYQDAGSICLDQAAGDGQFLSQVLINKTKSKHSKGMSIHDSFVTSLDEIFGVDIEADNVKLCRERLLCGCTDADVIDLVHSRIIIGDCLNPYESIPGQTELDRSLMIKYFGSKTGAFLHDLRAIAQGK